MPTKANPQREAKPRRATKQSTHQRRHKQNKTPQTHAEKNRTTANNTATPRPQPAETEPLSRTPPPADPPSRNVTEGNKRNSEAPGATLPPSRFTPDQRYVLNHIAFGGTASTAADDLNCTTQRISNWKKRNPDFQAALIEARDYFIHRVADGLHEAESDSRSLIHDFVRDPDLPPHLRLRAALAIARRSKTWLPQRIQPEPAGPTYAVDITETQTEDAPESQPQEPNSPSPASPAEHPPSATNQSAEHAPTIENTTPTCATAMNTHPAIAPIAESQSAEAVKRCVAPAANPWNTQPSEARPSQPPIAIHPPGTPNHRTTTTATNTKRDSTDSTTQSVPTDANPWNTKPSEARPPQPPIAITTQPANKALTESKTTETATQSVPTGANPQKTANPCKPPSHSRLTDYTILRGESRRAFDDLFRELRASYEPKSPAEELTVLRLAQVFWTLRRLDGIEAAVWESTIKQQQQTQPRIPNAAALALPFLDLDENQLTRFQKRMDTARAQQEERAGRLTSQLLRFRAQRESAERHQAQQKHQPHRIRPSRAIDRNPVPDSLFTKHANQLLRHRCGSPEKEFFPCSA